MIKINELQTTSAQLPDTIEDLSKFVLVGRATLRAYMMRLQTIDRLSVAQEVRDQTFKEAQEVANALVAAEQRIGEILLSIQKKSGGDRQSKDFKNRDASNFETKSEITTRMGYSKDQVSQYQQLAQNPEVVEAVIKKATENGEIVSRSQVMKEIRALKEELARARQQKTEVKEVRVEVPPADYQTAKSKARAYDAETGRLNKKLEEAYQERNELAARVHELEFATKEGLDKANLSENIVYFCTICNNFIGNVGGLVWLTDRINDMPKGKKEMFLKAACSFRDWAEAFSMNLERRMNEDGKSDVDTRVPLLADKK